MNIAIKTFVWFGSMGLLAGCSGLSTDAEQRNPASVRIEASSRDIVSGETVTLTARTRDTYGRSPTVRWTSSAGSLTTEQDGRVARVRFNEPGTYSVKAALSIDGREVQSDMVEVRVKPVS